jgi:putative transposase
MYAVRNLYTSLLVLLTQATDREMSRIVRYVVEENRTLRARLPDRINVTRKERNRLLRFGRNLGTAAIQKVVGIVSPSTFPRWIREESKSKKKRSGTRGRPKSAADIRELILLMAKENAWGYTRIMGELKKLGIKPPSRNTVKKILKAAGFEPGPRRGEGTWDEFLFRHAKCPTSCYDWGCHLFCTPAEGPQRPVRKSVASDTPVTSSKSTRRFTALRAREQEESA